MHLSIGEDRLTALTDSLLTKERLAWGINLYGDACGYDGDSQYHTDASREHDVKGSLKGKVAWPTFLGGNSIGIGSRCPIASCRYETLRRRRVFDRRRKFRRHRSLRTALSFNVLTDQRRTSGNISSIFCFIRHVLFQDFVPGLGILPVLYSDRQQLGDRLFEIAHYTLLV